MEQLNRMNRPAPASPQVPVQAPMQNGGSAPKKQKNIKSVKALTIVKITAIAVAVVLVMTAVAWFVYKNTQGVSSQIQKDKYQAVFLNSADGQVYFGKLSVMNNDYYKLEDIYYVRVEQVQPNPNEQAQQNISLAKLGNEIHGPQDVMYIRNDHVMFWENLKDDGQVVTAITEYKKNGGNTNTNNQSQPNTNNTTNNESNSSNTNTNTNR